MKLELQRGKPSHRTPDERAAEELEVLRLKVLGKRDVDIARDLGMSLPTVKIRLRAAVERHGQASVKEYREIAEQRYSFLFNAASAVVAADPTNMDAIRTATMIAEKAAKLEGAEMPVQAQIEVHQVSEQEAALRDMLAQAQRDEKVRESTLIEGEVVDA